MLRVALLVPDGFATFSFAPLAAFEAANLDECADGVHLSYDRMASFLAVYGNRDALQVAEDLDNKIETLLREAAA